MTVETSKTLGGIGALLIVVGFLALFGGSAGVSALVVLSLVGIVLLLIGVKGLADHYKEGGIFNNALYGFITTIIGAVAFVGIAVVAVLQALSTLSVTDWTDWATKVQQNAMDWSTFWPLIEPIVIGIVAAFIVLFVFIVVAAILYRKSLNLLATKSGVKLFETAGLLLLIGAVLTIILVGFIIIWVAVILVAVAFFSIKTEAPAPPPTPPPS
jgi:uncharacterized membrane protein